MGGVWCSEHSLETRMLQNASSGFTKLDLHVHNRFHIFPREIKFRWWWSQTWRSVWVTANLPSRSVPRRYTNRQILSNSRPLNAGCHNSRSVLSSSPYHTLQWNFFSTTNDESTQQSLGLRKENSAGKGQFDLITLGQVCEVCLCTHGVPLRQENWWKLNSVCLFIMSARRFMSHTPTQQHGPNWNRWTSLVSSKEATTANVLSRWEYSAIDDFWCELFWRFGRFFGFLSSFFSGERSPTKLLTDSCSWGNQTLHGCQSLLTKSGPNFIILKNTTAIDPLSSLQGCLPQPTIKL